MDKSIKESMNIFFRNTYSSINDFTTALAPSGVPAAQSPIAPASDGSLPRGYRNNNPLNIEAGSFTQGQPGFA
ncbi:MAG: hypothetical protein AABY22_02220, partial [Nanoarchaeota archaeon]